MKLSKEDNGGGRMDIQIIGGPDGPTTIYLSAGPGFYIAVAVIVLLIVFTGYVIFRKRKKGVLKP